MNHDQRCRLQELDYRLHRLEKELLQTELLYELALVTNRNHVLHELRLEMENIKRKLNWFAGAIRKFMQTIQQRDVG